MGGRGFIEKNRKKNDRRIRAKKQELLKRENRKSPDHTTSEKIERKIKNNTI
jgi:hypothetical protein